jgi:hypothetical protein
VLIATRKEIFVGTEAVENSFGLVYVEIPGAQGHGKMES